MANKDFELQIGGDSTAAEAAFKRVIAAGQEAAKKLGEEFHKMGETTEKVNGIFEKMAGIFTLVFGAEKIVESAKHIAEYADEVDKSSQKTGIAAEKIQGLQFAAKMSDISAQDLDTSLKKLARSMEAAGSGTQETVAAFKAIGINAADLKNMKTDEVLKKIADQFAKSNDGAGKAAVAMALFGKAGTDMIPFLNKGSASINELMQQADKLGLVLGGPALEGAGQLDDQFKIMDAQMDSIHKRMSIALVPAFLQITNSFITVTQKGGVMEGMFDELSGMLISLTKGASYVVQAFIAMGITINATSAAVLAVLDGDFKLARKIMDLGQKDIEESTKKFEAFRAALEKPVDVPKKENTVEDANKSNIHIAAPGKDASRTGEWKAELERQLELERQFFKSSTAEELQFWQTKLALIKGNGKKAVQERQQVQHEIYTLEKRQAQDQLSSDLEELKTRAAAYRAGSVERIRLAGESAQMIGEKYGLESKEYKAALKDMQQAAHEHQAELLKIENQRIELEKSKKMQGLEMDKLTLNLKTQLGQISAVEELAALRDLEDQKYQIELQALRDKAELYNADTQEYSDAMAKIEELAGQHALAMQGINNQIAIEQKNEWTKMMDPLTRAIDQSAQGIIMGTTTMQKALSNIFQSILAEFISTQTKRVVAWIAGEHAQTAATVAGVGMRNTAEQAGAGQSLLLQAGMAIKKIMNSAAEVFAGIFSFLSPEMGPFAAGPAAAGMGAVSAMAGSVMLASQGYDIPAGINPLTRLHEREMVLPAAHADVVRDMASGRSGGGGDTHHYHIHAMDADSFRDYLTKNATALTPALRKLNRNFTPVK